MNEFTKILQLIKFEAIKLKQKKLHLLNFIFIISTIFSAKIDTSFFDTYANDIVMQFLNINMKDFNLTGGEVGGIGFFFALMIAEHTKESLKIEGSLDYTVHQLINGKNIYFNLIMKIFSICFFFFIFDAINYEKNVLMIIGSSLVGFLWFLKGFKVLTLLPIVLVNDAVSLVSIPFLIFATATTAVKKVC